MAMRNLSAPSFLKRSVQIKDFSDWTAQPYEEYFGTDVFQQYVEDNCDTLQSLVWWKYMNFSFCYSVIMPGRAIPSPHSIVTNNVHTYYLNLGMIYAGDYTITAKSRDFNLWAWILSTFLIVFSILCCLPRKK